MSRLMFTVAFLLALSVCQSGSAAVYTWDPTSQMDLWAAGPDLNLFDADATVSTGAGETFNWTGIGSPNDNWWNTANWDLNASPGTADTAVFNLANNPVIDVGTTCGNITGLPAPAVGTIDAEQHRNTDDQRRIESQSASCDQ